MVCEHQPLSWVMVAWHVIDTSEIICGQLDLEGPSPWSLYITFSECTVYGAIPIKIVIHPHRGVVISLGSYSNVNEILRGQKLILEGFFFLI